MTLRVVSHGGGVQTTALLALAAQGKIPARTFIFANTGDDSENEETLVYLRETAMPFAAAHGIELIEVHHTAYVGGPKETLRERLVRADRMSLPIPVYYPGRHAAGRACTVDYKIKVVRAELLRRGASADDPAIVSLGFSLDELGRAKSASGFPDQVLDYPLIRLRLYREDCTAIIKAVIGKVPPKSACKFCPFKRDDEWSREAEEEPDTFAANVELEDTINTKRAAKGLVPVYLHRSGMPLREAIKARQLPLVGTEELCTASSCWT